MSGAIRTRCLVPPKLGDSSAAAELTMATVTAKEAVAHRISATELRQGPWGPTPLYLGALKVSHGTAADQVSRKMKYLAAKLAVVQEDRSQGKIKTEKANKDRDLAGILTKPLQAKEYAFKRGCFLGLRVVPPAKLSSSAAAATSASGAKGETDRARCPAPGPAPGTWGRAVEGLFGRGRG